MDKPVTVGALTLSRDVGPAGWIVAGVRPDAGPLIPAGLEAYARILHPAVRWDGDVEVEVPWSQVAAATGSPVHPAMTWEATAGAWAPNGHPGVWDDEPIEGQPAPSQVRRLVALLAGFTTEPNRCWYAVWDGYGALELPRDGVPRVELPGRSMLLLSGRLDAAGTSLEAPPFDRRANLWWPDDHAWVVATDVYATSTLIGGSAACIAAVLADDQIEALPAEPG
jgi:hypothetical protein